MKHQENLFPPMETHICEGYTRGNWIVYKCAECSYTQHFNWKTGKMITKGNRMALHSGSHVPTIKRNPSDDLY